jgi:hypothetical protein
MIDQLDTTDLDDPISGFRAQACGFRIQNHFTQ